MIAIVDYGVGNLFSLVSSFTYVGYKPTVTGDPEKIRFADRIILPGVGAFQDAVGKLKASGLFTVLQEEAARGKPLMGVCLGMQMLFDKSYEYGEYEGLGLISGQIRPISEVIDPNLKIPHIGWNALKFRKPSSIFENVREGEHVYFVHSYYATNCEDAITAVAEYDADICAAVQKDNVFGCQFHPEKSGDTGLKIIKSFCEWEG